MKCESKCYNLGIGLHRVMDYSKSIKELRKKLIVSQAELAKMLGCSFASVNRWENGLHEPTYKMKRRIVELCKKNKIKTED